jgi:Spy/CpxP family protein refolding chaperone
MKKLLLGGLLALSLAMNLSFGVVYLLQSRVGGGEPGSVHGAAGAQDCLLEQLTLNEHQQAQLGSLRSEMLALRQREAPTMAAQRAELADAIAAEHPDEAAIARLLEQYSAAQQRLQQRAVEHLLRVRGLLDDTQREQFRLLLRTRIFQGIRSLEGSPEHGR